MIFLKVCLVFLLLFIHLYAPVFSHLQETRAESQTEKAEEALQSNIEDLIGKLDLQALQEYVDSLGVFVDDSVQERLLAYIRGESFRYDDFGKALLSVLFENACELLPVFACITAITLLSGILSSLRSGTLSSSSANMIFLVSYTTALIPLISVLTEVFQKVLKSVGEMQLQMQISFPLLLTLMATSGGALTVAICKPIVAFFSNVIVALVSSVVLPLSVAIIAFSMASNLTNELKISKFGAFFKSINKWLIGICVSVFGLFFTLQGVTSATHDGIVRRVTKYAIGNGIPIVGGFLSGGFDLAVAGSILIKNSIGSMSLFLMVAVLFEPLVLLLAVTLFLRFTSAITQPFGDSKISDFLGETADNLRYCTAGLLFTAFFYFLTIMLFVSSSEALL